MNPARGEQTITIKGKEYTLRPTFSALMEFEAKAGVSVFKALAQMAPEEGESASKALENLSVGVITAAIWAGIRGADKTKAPSYEAIGAALVEEGLMNYLVPVANFLAAGMGANKEVSPPSPTTAG